jgi:hypothetical protein
MKYLVMKSQTLYCSICEHAWIETTETRNDLFYCCTMCRDNEKERNIQDNNYQADKVIDYGNG